MNIPFLRKITFSVTFGMTSSTMFYFTKVMKGKNVFVLIICFFSRIKKKKD